MLNNCLEWDKFVRLTLTYPTPDSCLTYTYQLPFSKAKAAPMNEILYLTAFLRSFRDLHVKTVVTCKTKLLQNICKNVAKRLQNILANVLAC